MNYVKINGDIFLTSTIARIINRVDQGTGVKHMVVVLHEKNEYGHHIEFKYRYDEKEDKSVTESLIESTTTAATK